MEYALGIDTSNYTTSLAAAPLSGGEVVFVRRLLSAPALQVGLRQSDAHFLHTKYLPDLAAELKEKLPRGARFCRVCVSTRPRPQEGSYMPCFLSGVSAAHAAALALGVQVQETSHQEGHIAAALYGCPDFPRVGEFYSMHLSGGTMELVRVKSNECGYEIAPLLSTLDVTAGQLIDRAGVMLGFAFPCGREMDALALRCAHDTQRMRFLPKSGGVNLSGLQNRAEAMHAAGETPEHIAHFLLSNVARAIELMYEMAGEDLPLLLCGGVSASAFLRKNLRLKQAYFTEPALATDTAVGVALLGVEKGESV